MDLMTTAQLLGNFGEFIGSVAIFVTLIYLAIQIRQSARSATQAAVQANRAERLAWFKGNRDSPYLPAIFEKYENGEALSRQDQYRLTAHHAALWGHIYSQWINQELRLAGRFATKDTAVIGMALSTPGAMETWKNMSTAIYPDEFCQYVETRISELRQAAPAFENQ